MIFGNDRDDAVHGGVGSDRIWILPTLLLAVAVAISPPGVGDAAAQVDEKPFVTTWRVDAAGGNVTIPVGGATGTYTIFWGDGTFDTDVSSDQHHTYAMGGNYTVSIYGDFARIHLDGQPSAQKLLSIDQWGDVQWTSMASAFSGASNMAYNAADSPNLSAVTDTFGMFYDARSFNGDISSWDVSVVTDMSVMFGNAHAFNGDISAWDVSSVTDMFGMFYNAPAFNGDISAWDTSSVTDMSWMFSGASPFNGDIYAWDTSSVTDMSGMFYGATSFNGNLSAWDTSSVTNMRDVFAWSSFNGDISSWDASSVTDMSSMFLGTTAFNGDISSWDTSSVTDTSGMFMFSSFNGDLSDWDVSSVTNMAGMFAGSSFNGDISSWDTSSVTDMSWMFWNASSFNGDISSLDTSSVTDMSEMLADASSFDQNLGEWYVTIDSVSIDRADVPGVVGTISAQNSYLDGQNPTYVIESGGDSDRFAIVDGNRLSMVSAAADRTTYTVTISATGGSVFGDGNNHQDIQVTLKDGGQ